mmetsp:Transcript_16318/g.52228  ORF Transcript_16318/g.52228 Transcript_16318/m.52228 type:complete len:221 (+) Transcript_16318:113-775(+)
MSLARLGVRKPLPGITRHMAPAPLAKVLKPLPSLFPGRDGNLLKAPSPLPAVREELWRQSSSSSARTSRAKLTWEFGRSMPAEDCPLPVCHNPVSTLCILSSCAVSLASNRSILQERAETFLSRPSCRPARSEACRNTPRLPSVVAFVAQEDPLGWVTSLARAMSEPACENALALASPRQAASSGSPSSSGSRPSRRSQAASRADRRASKRSVRQTKDSS